MPDPRITDQPDPGDFVRFRPGFGQRFIVTVDAEEEFDWRQPLRPSGHTLHAVSRLAKFQTFCEGAGITPVYLVDYPIAMSELAGDLLRDAVAAGRAEIGLQLHPWVNPPLDEEINEFNSFAGNLPVELEEAKFVRLRDAVAANFGAAPQVYRAGRYGVGPATAGMLRRHGIAIDSSVRARFDYSQDGGPNFRDLPVRPWWIGRPGSLMELPLTTVFRGGLRRYGPWLYPRLWRVPLLRGLLARAGLLERIPLTPEGVTLPEISHAIDSAIADALPVIVFAFHSPSLQPGHTPYVRSEAELDAFYDWWRAVFTLLARRQIRPVSIAELMASAELA